jgi:hypothetical protein
LPQGKQAAPHLDLAQWCLRYGLLEQASEQVLTAMRVEPNHAGIDALLRQIRAAGDKGADAAGQTPPRAADTLRAAPLDELDQLARSVPQPALAMFASRVQPLLINRCGGSACHTGHRAGAFRLLEPPRGGTYFRRLTLRNLQTTLAQVNLEVPDESPLLATPQKAHGPTNVVVISGQSDQLYRQLREWIDKLNGLESKADSLDAQSEENKSPGGEVSQEGSPPESNSIGRMVPTQPADATAKSAVPFGSAEPPKGTRFSAVPPSRSGAAERDEKRVVSPLIGDPFDPSLFNRKFHGRP